MFGHTPLHLQGGNGGNRCHHSVKRSGRTVQLAAARETSRNDGVETAACKLQKIRALAILQILFYRFYFIFYFTDFILFLFLFFIFYSTDFIVYSTDFIFILQILFYRFFNFILKVLF